MSSIRIVNYSSDWYDAHFDFASQNYGSRRKRRNCDYIYWKFRGTFPHELTNFLLAVTIDNKVIGQLGLIPSSITINEEIFPCYWACDLMVDPNFRGKNIANALYEIAKKKGLLFGSSPSPAAAKSMSKFGFQSLVGPYFLFFHRNIIDSYNWIFQKFKFNFKGTFINVFGFFSFFISWVFTKKLYSLDLNTLINRISNKTENRFSDDILYFERSDAFLNWRLKSFQNYQREASNITFRNSYVAYLTDDFNNIYVGHLYFRNLVDFIVLNATLISILFKNKGKYLYLNTTNRKEISVLFLLGFWLRPRRVSIIYFDGLNVLKDYQLKDFCLNYTYFDSDERL